jgi:putative nucleotidyltransferase with HDIG domain
MDVTLTPRIAPPCEKKPFVALDKPVADLPYLPPAFQLVPRLLLLISDPEADSEEMAEIIRVDPGLTTNIFRAANSASCGAARKASSLNEALLRLGMREVYRFVTEVITAPALKTADVFAVGRVDLWTHSLATAVAAQVLARHLTEEDPEVVFTAALLHDIGKAVLGRAVGQRYFEVLEICAETNRSVHCAEREAFLTDHTEVAGRLLRAWKVPDAIVAAVAGHHAPRKLKDNARLGALVYTANVLAYRINQGNGFPSYAVSPEEETLALIGTDNGSLNQFEDEVLEMLRWEQQRLRIH